MSNPATGETQFISIAQRRIVNHYVKVYGAESVRPDVDTHVKDGMVSKFDVMSGRNLRKPWWRMWNGR